MPSATWSRDQTSLYARIDIFTLGSTGRWPVGDGCQPSRTSLQRFCYRFETRSFPIFLVAYPRDFAFYVADPISSIHRSSRINWIRVDSCAFVVTTNLASGSSSDSGRADQRNHFAFKKPFRSERSRGPPRITPASRMNFRELRLPARACSRCDCMNCPWDTSICSAACSIHSASFVVGRKVIV